MHRYRLTIEVTVQAADKVEAEEAARVALRSPYVLGMKVTRNIGSGDIPEDGHAKNGGGGIVYTEDEVRQLRL